jgi:SOS-response transcriptional repressor LexA
VLPNPKQTLTSDMQWKIYNFIVNHAIDEGMPPNKRQISQALKITNSPLLDYHLSILEREGLISLQPKKVPGIKLLKRLAGIPVMGMPYRKLCKEEPPKR